MEPASSSDEYDSESDGGAVLGVSRGDGGGGGPPTGLGGSDSESSDGGEGAPAEAPFADMPLGMRRQLVKARGVGAVPPLAAGKPGSWRGAKRAGGSSSESDASEDSDSDDERRRQPAAPAKRRRVAPPKRANKNCPAEMSSRRKPRKLQQVVAVPKRETRDPRFEEVSGRFSADHFRKHYEFLDGMQADEVKRLKKALKKTKSTTKAGELQATLTRVQQSLKTRKREGKVADRLKELRRAEADAVAAGKKPFFMSRKVKKDVVQSVRAEELKDRGGLARLAAKRGKRQQLRQRIASKRTGVRATPGPRLGT